MYLWLRNNLCKILYQPDNEKRWRQGLKIQKSILHLLGTFLKQMKNIYSSDVYGLNVRIIKPVKNLIVIPLTKLINLCLKECISPKVLKNAVVTPIFKKGDSSDVANYRTISILPIISKIVEKCMAVKIAKHFEENGLYCDNQFGFRKGRNTVQGILNLLQKTNNIIQSISMT